MLLRIRPGVRSRNIPGVNSSLLAIILFITPKEPDKSLEVEDNSLAQTSNSNY